MSQRTGTWRQGEQALRDRPRVIAESKAAEAQRQKEYEERCLRAAKLWRKLGSLPELNHLLCEAGNISFDFSGHRYEISEVE